MAKMLFKLYSLPVIVLSLLYVTKTVDGDELMNEMLRMLHIPFRPGYTPIDEGNEAFARGDYKQAIGCYSEAIDARPGIKEHLVLRGYCYHKENDLAKAIEDLRAAVVATQESAYSLAWTCLIRALLEAEKTADVEGHAKRLRPSQLTDYGELLENVFKDKKSALWCYTKAIENDPAPDAENTFFCTRAALHYRMEEYEKAVEDYEKLTPRTLSICTIKATLTYTAALYKLGKYRKAVDVLFFCGDDPMGVELDKLAIKLAEDKKTEDADRCFAAANKKRMIAHQSMNRGYGNPSYESSSYYGPY